MSDEFEKKTNYCIYGFGHSLWSASRLPAQVVDIVRPSNSDASRNERRGGQSRPVVRFRFRPLSRGGSTEVLFTPEAQLYDWNEHRRRMRAARRLFSVVTRTSVCLLAHSSYSVSPQLNLFAGRNSAVLRDSHLRVPFFVRGCRLSPNTRPNLVSFRENKTAPRAGERKGNEKG